MQTPYRRTYSFAGFQANRPRDPLPGQHLDIELDEIADNLARAGASAYDIAVLNGFVGTEADWLVSLKGDSSVGSGDSIITGTAAAVTAGHRVLYARTDGTGLAVASASDVTQVGRVVGVSLNAALAGTPITYVNDGPIDEPSWNFVPGPVWLGEAGAIVQAQPDAGFAQVVGTAVAPTRIVVSLQIPIILS